MAKISKAEKREKARKKLAKAERKLAEAARELEKAEQSGSDRDLIVAETETTLTLPPELAERLKSTGKGWQQKAEAALALWLDEASLALRQGGMTGLSETMKSKAETATETARAVRSTAAETNMEKMVKTTMNTVGRDIAQAALGAAFAAFTSPRPDGAKREADDMSATKTGSETPTEPELKPAPARKPPTRKKPVAKKPAAKAAPRRKPAAKRGPASKGKSKPE